MAFLVQSAQEILIAPAWSREEEEAADILGIDILFKSKAYSRAAPAEYLEIYAESNRKTVGKRSEKRKEEQERKINEAVEKRGILGGFLQAGSVFKYSWKEARNSLTRSHKGGEVRSVKATDYIFREYPGRGDPKSFIGKPLAWSDDGGSKALAKLFRHYAAASKVQAVLDAKDLKKAAKLADTGVTRPTFTHSYPRYQYYKVRKEQGDMKRARANLEIALRGDSPSLSIYKALIALDADAGRLSAAFEHLEAARRELDDPPQLWPVRIDLYKRADRTKAMKAALLECERRYPEVAKVCREAVYGKE